MYDGSSCDDNVSEGKEASQLKQQQSRTVPKPWRIAIGGLYHQYQRTVPGRSEIRVDCTPVHSGRKQRGLGMLYLNSFSSINWVISHTPENDAKSRDTYPKTGTQ